MPQLRILSILDDFTFQGLNQVENIKLITNKPFWYRKSQKIDFFLVESAWRGNQDQWRHKIADYPNHPNRNNHELIQLVNWAKDHRIPTIFWNKEDPYHYDQFIDSAKHFDYIFTTDDLSLARYKKDAPNAKVNVLPFFIQTHIHKPEITNIRNRSLFIGSYHTTEHPERRQWQDTIFPVATQFGLTIVDRNSASQSLNQQFPRYTGDLELLPAIPYNQTQHMYNQFSHCLNVNSITQSNTMFSRRLLEIMACGRLAISNPSQAIDHLFPNMCICLNDPHQALDLFKQLKKGYTSEQNNMRLYAQAHVNQHYNVNHWLQCILDVVNL